ncbi:contactin-associated protein-like 2a [Sinocyclocheilus grahami]|uniref:contactin-associated protein-like 2a n=1 Tax=Sinocyclocheilus grahami TaxID=75366 RepID=UPI0007AD0CAA|nr:PREDICTED: contactin-associated protein-like 2 [Sinocyclocheilus grahami]
MVVDIEAFAGNSNTESVVRHDLQNPTVAHYLRIIPLDWSEEGRIGLRFEIYGCPYWADVINFDGQGVISYRFKMKKMKILKDVIALKFKTSESEGVILHGEGQQGDYITLELRSGRLLLQINLGSNQYGSILGHTSVTSGSLLDDHHWHSVVIERYRRNVNFTLDQHTQHFRTNGEFDHLDLDYELTFGGMPYSGKPVSGGRRNFKGCMESINYNGENITDLARRKKLDTSSFRNLTFSCVDIHTFPVFFNSTSFLQLPGRRDHNMVSVGFQFRTWNPSGLLLFSSLADGMLELALNDGKVTAHINVTQQKNMRVDIASGSGLNDGEWHDVRFLAKENFAMLTIDGDEASAVRTTSPVQITTGSTYHFGGYFLRTRASPIQRSFQGCMQLIQVDDQLADLTAVEQGRMGAFENVSLDMCAIIDRCMPNQCEHGGRCSQIWDGFTCTCDGTGYTGATCHTSVYEQSCEAYKHLGRSSDSYWIDPDGSGPLGPFKVICNMTEDKVWTTVVNNLPAQTAVTGSSRERRTVLQLNYSASMEQVTAITNSAEHCEQQVAYACRMSRLLNTPDGTPYTWWVGRGNEKHFYWGGSVPGIQKCACGIERNCTDSKYYCNCDADQKQWRDDSGLLVYKDHLPVSQVAVGDTNRPGSEAKLTVGPLCCYGDRSYWNAASFNTPSSYLHFSTFQGETSADISFYFKTSAPYGVFLENLGNTDFIRLELKSPMVVSFSFDVGNGPVELNVHSPTPLNDDQWHRVSAERNTKEAILQLDQKYKEVRPAPTQGHTRLELYSQLYVGAAGGQRGFLGCIRSLKMNGVTLDLEERAKVTPGVKPGCSGHCTSFGMYCRNGGKCVEKYNGYSCDCSTTAFDGPFCSKAPTVVSFSFDVGNGPVELNVHSPTLLNDDQWHRVSAERSTKEAILQLDQKYQEVRPAPTQGHTRLELYSQLYVGAAGGQRGFLGCIRSLKMNGVTLDLEERAKVTPGVKPGCSGHCTSFGMYCRNGGKCVEKYNGYSCDCSTTAFDGPFCSKDVGGFFEAGTLVKYNLVPEVMAAASSLDEKSVIHNLPVETNLTCEDLTFSFSTSTSPSLLVYVSSKTQDYMAVVLRHNGTLQLRYNLGGLREPFSIDIDQRNLANGQPHTVNISRVERDIEVQLDHYPPVSYSLPEASDTQFTLVKSLFLGKVFGIIAVVIFTILCTLVFLIRYMFRHKGTYHTNEAKGGESSESADTAIIGTEANFTETIDESKKEWFI